MAGILYFCTPQTLQQTGVSLEIEKTEKGKVTPLQA
jgi:hypothetical protein